MTLVTACMAELFEHSAAAARQAEDVYRKTSAAELARLEVGRVTAFRRVRLIRLLESAASAAPAERDPLDVQRHRLCQEIGWTGELPAQQAVLDRMVPLCRALQPKSGASAAEVRGELEAFETWFQAERGVPFYRLFDEYVQETPVVDF